MTNKYVKEVIDEQDIGLEVAKQQCISDYGDKVLKEVLHPTYNESIKSYMCPAYWDSIVCWPDTLAGDTATHPCPHYFAGFFTSENASKRCMENGVWFVSPTENKTWSNYTTCYTSKVVTIFRNDSTANVDPLLQKYTPIVRFVSNSGYVVSLSTLLIAFAIMLFIRRLHCARNILHMHLFASFIMRSLLSVVRSASFVDGVGFPSDFYYFPNGTTYFHVNMLSNNWSCKVATTFLEYFLAANYSWILMEGLYLHNLIFRALFVDSSNSIRWYIILGWGLPLIKIAVWVATLIFLEDKLCWTSVEHTALLIIEIAPTSVSVLINLVLFMRISMVLYIKLRSPINEDSHRYQKWIKSTLVLVPLFGIHYGLLLTLYFLRRTNSVVELVWLIVDQFFASLQGCFVAILYCFLNGEVRAEIQPHVFSFLTFLATNKCFQHLFPCRKKFLRSVVGRSSVCTTMSCSSLYANGVLHRNSKSRLDSLPKTKQLGEKSKDHICQNGNKTAHDTSRRNSKQRQCSQSELDKHLQSFLAEPAAETTLTIERSVCPAESEITEETLRMM